MTQPTHIQPLPGVSIFVGLRSVPEHMGIPSEGWVSETAYNPVLQVAYQPQSSPGAKKLIWDRALPDAEKMYTAFLSDMRSALGDLCKDDNLFPSDELTLLSLAPGDSVVPHRDDGGVIIENGRSKRCKFTALWYFSSADLQGGDLYFPEHPLGVPAHSGTQVIFDAHEKHEVMHVQRGTRYAMLLRFWSWES